MSLGADAQSADQLRKRLGALRWWQDDVASGLSPDLDQWATVEATAVAIRDSDGLRIRRIGDLLPGLERLASKPSRVLFVGTRAGRVLRNYGDTWEDLAQRSAHELGAWHDCGEKTVLDIVDAVIHAWAGTDPIRWFVDHDAQPETQSTGPQPTVRGGWPSVAETRAMVALHRFCRGAYRIGAKDIGGAIEAAAGTAPATDTSLEHAWTFLCALRLEELLGIESRVEQAWVALLDFNERELRILGARFSTDPEPLTLVALGREFGVTRERIRQIETRCRKRIGAGLETDACIVIAHTAARLRREHGTLIPAGALDAALEGLLPKDSRHALLCRDILLAQAGPYRLEDGFWQTGHPLSQIEAALSARSDERWTHEQLDSLLDEVDVVAVHREACRSTLLPGVVNGLRPPSALAVSD